MSSSFNLRDKVCNSLTPWMLSASLFQRVRAPSEQKGLHHECEVLRSDPEWDFVNSYFFQHAPLTYSIKRIFCVHNPSQTEQFEASLKTMDGEAQNPIFAPKWDKEDPTGCRAKVMARWRESAFSSAVVVRTGSRNEFLSHVFVFPYWHGSNQEKVQSICDTGFAYFGKHSYLQGDGTGSTDIGFFGSGIYFTNSARYAADIYSSGHLLLAWVSMRSSYPVIGEKEDSDRPSDGEEEDSGMPSDMKKLQGRHAFENYDAHYTPVIAVDTSNPMCPVYHPCRKDQSPMWDEIVVFQKSQTLPRFYVELMVTLPTTPDSPLAMLTQLLKYLQQLSNEPEIIKNSQLLSLFQQKKQLLFVIGDTSHLSSVDQKFFDLVRQLQTGAAKLNDCIIQRFLALIPSPLPAPPAIQPSPEPPVTFLPSPFDTSLMLEFPCAYKEVLEEIFVKKGTKDVEEATKAFSLSPFFQRWLAWSWVMLKHTQEIPIVEFDESTSVLLLENGQMVTWDSNAVRIWDLLSRQCLQLFTRGPNLMQEKILSLGKERLLFLRNQQELVIWDPCANKILQRFNLIHVCFAGNVKDFILLKNGCIAIIYHDHISDKHKICLWNPLTEECQSMSTGIYFGISKELEEICLSDHFESIELFPMGKDYLVTAHSNDLIIWSLNEKKNIFSEKNVVDFCLSDEEVVYCKDSVVLFVFNPSKSFFKKQRQLKGHKEKVLCCYRLKDGRVVSGSKDKTLKIWDTQSCQCVNTLEWRTPVTKIWELNNGLIVSRGEDNTLGVWDLRSRRLWQEFFLNDVKSVEEMGEGKILVVSKTKTAIFDRELGVRVCTFPGKGRCLKEGSILCHFGRALQFIDPTSGRALQTFGFPIVSTPTPPYQLSDGRKLIISGHSIFLEEKRGVFQRVVSDMDPVPLLFLNERLVLVEKNGNFQVVNPRNGEVLNTFPCYRKGKYKKLISVPNGKLVALSDDRIDIWDRKCGQIIKSLHLKEGLRPFWLSGNVRFLARKLGENFQVFLEKSAVLKTSFHCKAVELQNGGIVGVSEDCFLKVWDTEGKCLRVLKGHEAKISFAIELRENRLISGSKDGVLKIWDLQSGNVVYMLKGHKSEITAICELKDGLIASADREGLRVWSSQGKLLYNLPDASCDSILSLKDGRFATFSSFYERYRIWNPKDGKCEQEVETKPHLGGFCYFAQREDGNLSIFVDGYDRCECVIFDLRTGKVLGRPLIAQKSFRISKEKMVSFFNGRAFLWDLASGKCIRQMQAPSDRVEHCILLQDGSLLTGFADGTLQKWEQNEKGGVKTWNRRKMTALLQLRDGRIVIGSHDTLEVWSSDIGECLSTWDGYNGDNLLQLEDGSLIEVRWNVTGKPIYNNVGWNVRTGQPICCSSVDFEWIEYKRKIQDFERFCGSNCDQNPYKILDLSQERDLQWVLENETSQLQVGIDLHEGFLVYEDSHLQILDPKTNIILRSFESGGAVRAVCLLKDGSLATIFKRDDYYARLKTIYVLNVLDLHTGKYLRDEKSPLDSSEQKEPLSITWFRALEKVASDEASSTLKVWDSLSETCKAFFRNLDDHSFPITQLDDGSFAFFSQDREGVEIWDQKSNKRLDILGGKSLKGVLLLQDGSILDWIEGNPTIRIWNPADGKTVQVLRGHLDSVTCVIQSRKDLIVSGSKDNTLKVWDLQGGNCLQTLQGHRGAINSVIQLSEDRLLSGSEDGTLKVWNFMVEECLKTMPCSRPVYSLFQLQDGRILSRSAVPEDARQGVLQELRQVLSSLIVDTLGVRLWDFQLWDLKRGIPIRHLMAPMKMDGEMKMDGDGMPLYFGCEKDIFDQFRFQDQVLGKETIHLDLWHPFFMASPFPDLFSSLSPLLNRLEKLEQAPLALLHLARAQAKEKDLFGIQETFRSLSDLLQCPELFELLGDCVLLAQEHGVEEMRAFYEKAVEQYESRGQKEDLIRGYEKLLALDSENFSLYEKLLQLYEEKEKKIALLFMGILVFGEKTEKAKVFVERAKKLDPANPCWSYC